MNMKGGGILVAHCIIKRTLRLNESLNKKLCERAKELGVSVNAYIIMVLSEEMK